MEVKQIEKKFNTISVTSDQLNKNLESLRKKTINLSITSHNLEGATNLEKISSELAALVVISKNFKEDVEKLGNIVHSINQMAEDIKKLMKE